jgi:hypothetical protein
MGIRTHSRHFSRRGLNGLSRAVGRFNAYDAELRAERMKAKRAGSK